MPILNFIGTAVVWKVVLMAFELRGNSYATYSLLRDAVLTAS
jgi:hypothetical protein